MKFGVYLPNFIGARNGLGKKPASVKKALSEYEQAGATW